MAGWRDPDTATAPKKSGRTRLVVAASQVQPGDMVELEKTSSGIRLPANRTLVLDVRDDIGRVGRGPEEDSPAVWLRLDPTGVAHLKPTSVLGTWFLAPDEQLEVWR